MRWISKDSSLLPYLSDSTGKGNHGGYTGNRIPTGSVEEYQMKNIYDLAGNIEEWSMEVYDTDQRIIRAGPFDLIGSQKPVTYRSNKANPTTVFHTIGFRVALYV